MENYCVKCGTMLQDKNGAFCSNCGNTVKEETTDISSVLKKEEKLEKVKKPKKKLCIVIACVLAFAILVVGTIGGLKFFCNKSVDIIGDVNYNALTEGFTDVLITDEKTAIEAVGSVADLLGINDAEKELKSKSTNQVGEDKYYSLQQYYNDIPVYGKNVIVSADKDGKAIALTSNFTPIENDISIKPTVSQNEVDSSVKNYLGANDISIEEINEENLVIHIKDSECILAYWLTVNEYDTVLVDANTAKILNYKSAFSYAAAEVCSQDGKEKTMAWQNDDGSYHLYNDEYKISVYDAKGKDALDKNIDTETIYSTTNIFDKNAIIFLDSLINSSAYYKNLGFKGFDKIDAAINDGFDNGNNARGGGYGKDVYYGVVAVGTNFDFNIKDTIPHEVTHIITRTLVDWEGDDETGAINEAYSDIFGELIEASLSENNTPNWIHGQRNMMNPHEYENAKYPYPSSVNDLKNARTYKLSNGEIRYSTIANKKDGQDFSHFASTIISHSAYLMWNGIDGTKNQKIDENKLAELWYRALMLLHEDSDFSQCRNAVELSARIMAKNNTLTNEQYKCVASAFDKVGINRAAFTNKQRVSNKFTLSVLGANKSDDVNFDLTIYKYEKSGFDVYGNEIGKMLGLLPSEIKKVYEKENQKGKVKLELESGIYDIYVTEIADNGKENTIITRVVVSKSSKLTSDQLIIYTDFMNVMADIPNEELSDTTDAILSPKSAVDIYFANKSVWMENPDYFPMQGYGYCLLDLDFDGVLELINSVCDGSGKYSYNKFYKINLDELTVEEFQPESTQDNSDIDYYLMSNESKLLVNKTTGIKFYLFKNYERISTDEGIVSFAESYINDGKLYENYLFSEYWFCDNNTGKETKKYTFDCKNVSKSEYEQKCKTFYKENKDMNLAWKCISGDEFDKGSISEQKQLLLEAYLSFSYDGFSFNNAKTFDASFEIVDQSKMNNAKRYSMMDYYGKSINDVIELLGSDYTLMNGLIGGSWAGIYYEDRRCPFIFCYKHVGDIPTKCDENAILSGVVVYPEQSDKEYMVIDKLPVVCTLSEVSEVLDGECLYSELYDATEYYYQTNEEISIVFYWTEKSCPMEITVDFNKYN